MRKNKSISNYIISLSILVFAGLAALSILLFSQEIAAHTVGADGARCQDTLWGDTDCSCQTLSPYFGTKVWAAAHIADAESNCNPAARGLDAIGLFQIHESVHCGQTFTCTKADGSTESRTLSSVLSTCQTQLFDRTTNIIVACGLSGSGNNFCGTWPTCTLWTTARPIYCNIEPPTKNQWRNKW